MRGVAALAVLDWHARGQAPWGAAGVDLFFVISGFVIGKIASGKSPLEFLADRAWRIFPPYWIAAIPWFFFAAWGGALTVGGVLSSITLWPWWPKFAWPYLPAAWTLMFEILFYLAAALSIRTRSPRTLVILALALMGLNLLGAGQLIRFTGCALIAEFLMGLLIGRLQPSRSVAAALVPLAILLLWLSPAPYFVGIGGLSALRVLYWGLPAAALLYSGLAFEKLFAGPWARLPLFMGNASYALYLTHLTVLQFATGLAPLLKIVLCVTFGAAFHVWIERPILQKRVKRPQPVTRAEPLAA